MGGHIVHKEINRMSDLYETMYILRPDLGEEQADEAIAKYQTILQTAGAEDIEIQHRGKRRLAYEIKKQRDGIYIQMNYKGQGNEIAVLERAMRLSDDVIRYLTLKVDTPKAKAEPVEAEV
jgi:small subunit ribosomal protein S6